MNNKKTGLSPWVLEKLLPLLKEAVAPLLPVKVEFEKDTKGPGLFWAGEKIAGIRFVGLSPAEEKRWGPCALALVNEVFGRLVREKTIKGLPGPDLLLCLLQEGPKQGLVLKAKAPPLTEGIYALKGGFFFLPSENLSPKKLLLELTRKGLSFKAASYLIETEEDLALIPKFFDFFTQFGFRWFGGKAARYLASLGYLEETWPKLKALAKEANRLALLWLKGEREPLSCVLKKAKKALILSENAAVIALPYEEGLVSFLNSLSLTGGILPPGNYKLPLKALWASFEHALRLGEGSLIEFEPFSWHVLGDVFLDLGDLWAAQETFEAAKGGTKQPIELLNSLALVYSELGEDAKAEACLREALSLAPDDPLLAYNLALFLDQRSRPEALSFFKKAYALAQQSPFAEALATKLAAQNKWSEVLEVLTPLEQKLAPKGLFLLARAFYEAQEYQKALELFKRLAKVEPQNLEALGYLALLYIQLQGEYSVAEAVLPQLEKEVSLGLLVKNIRTLMEG